MNVCFRMFFCLVALFAIISCGGGSSAPLERDSTTTGGNGAAVTALSIQLTLTDSAGQVSDQLSAATPLTLSATVTDQDGNLVTDSLVVFSFAPDGLAVFSNDAGTASTGTSGTASINLLVGDNSGSGEVIATLSTGESASATYTSTGSTQALSIQLAFSNSNGQVSDQLSAATPLTLSATVTDQDGNLVTDSLVVFSFAPDGLAVFSNDAGTASTGTSGTASINLLVGDNSGSGEVIATLSTGETASATFTSTGTTQTPQTLSLALALTDSAGQVSDQLSAATPLTLSATVTDQDGNLITDSLLVFTFSPDGLAEFSNDAGTASTGTSGTASINLLVGDNSGSGEVIATLSTGESASATYTSTGSTQALSIQLAFSNSNGQVSDQLSAATPLTLSATVTDQDGNLVTDSLVVFSFAPDGLAVFSNDAGTASTGTSGTASINLLVGDNSGSGEVIATLSTGETASATFTSTGTTQTPQTLSLALALTDSAGQVSDQLSAATPLTLSATVTDQDGNLITDSLLVFTFSPDGLAEFSNDAGTASTGTSGTASIELLVGDNSGSGEVIATLSTGETARTTFTSAGTTQQNEQPASLDFFASSFQLASSGSDKIELIALVKNAQNILMEGVNVSFAVSADGALQVTQGATGPDGTARAMLTTLNNPENRTIRATVNVGVFSEFLDIKVVGTEITVNGPSSVILGDTAEYTILLANSDGRGIEKKEVQITSKNGNTLTIPDSETDSEGQVKFDFTATQSGVDELTVSALNLSFKPKISVQQDQFSFTTKPSADVPLTTEAEPSNTALTLTWLKDNVAFAGGTVTFTTTRGTLSASTVTTDAAGTATVLIESNNAGIAQVSAKGIDDEIEVNARAQVEFIATNVDDIIMSASPKDIGPDGQKSTIIAVLRDESGNLVKGKTINFTADDVTGGSISPASSVTDSNGIASTVYTSNSVSTEDGVIITATEPVSGQSESTKMTVSGRAQFISLGTGNIISEPDAATYLKTFAIFVTDASSNPVGNVELTVTGTPVKRDDLIAPTAVLGDPNFQRIRPAFYKGYWEPFPDLENFEFWIARRSFDCTNEDIGGDGILLQPAEDTNGDGEITPGNVVAIDGSVTTDANGQATVNLRYAKSFAAWTTIKITVSSPVSGSESSASQYYDLAVSGDDLVNKASTPNSNPYGRGGTLSEDPDNPGTLIFVGDNLTCTNSL